MGFFSWTSAVSGKSIFWGSEVVLVLPNNKIISGIYNGYGAIENKKDEPLVNILNWLAQANGKSDANAEKERINGIDTMSLSKIPPLMLR